MKASLIIFTFLLILVSQVWGGKDSTGIPINNQVKNNAFYLYANENHCSKKYSFVNFFDEPIMNLNIQQGWRTMGEIAFGLADYQGGRNNYGINVLQDFEIGSQFNFYPKHFIIGPEVSYNVSLVLVAFGASISYLTDFSQGTFYLNPHLGFTYNTYIDLYAGYNIPLMKNKMKSLVNNFTITLAFPLLQRKIKL